MSGGRFISMNKVRPGAYINFETNAASRVAIGTRGIATIMFPLSWGDEKKIIELTGQDMADGRSLAKIGLMMDDPESLILNLALQNCNTLKIFNPLSGGVQAHATLGENGITVTAKYPGTFGNKIAIVVKSIGTGRFSVETYANGYAVDVQKVSNVAELKANDYVSFSSTGTLQVVSSTLLADGTNGTKEANVIEDYFNALKLTKWNTMAHIDSADSDKVIEFIREMREEEGKYVQAVVANVVDADYEGIINNVNGIVLADGTEISALQFTAWVAGATAGADIIESITGKVVDGAVSIIGLLGNNEIVDALNAGKLVLSLNQEGNVKVEKDINSLHTFTADKNYIFSKNRVIRELDEIGSTIENIWETTYLGKVSNNDNGRTLFKSSIIDYLTDLQNRGAIQDFDSSTVEVSAGDDIDTVIASIVVKPVDSMEFLYLVVNVEQ